MDTQTLEVDARILSLTPDIVIGWGLNLFLADTLDRNSHMAFSAAKALTELEGLMDSFPSHSRERIYLTALRLAATGFARGIERRKYTLRERLKTAREAKEVFVKDFAKGQRFNAIALGGFKQLMLGGFVFALARALALLPAVANETHGMNLQYASLAFALGLTLVGSFAREWLLKRELVRAFKQYDLAIDNANKAYVCEVVVEYRLAADTAEKAWRLLTGVN